MFAVVFISLVMLQMPPIKGAVQDDRAKANQAPVPTMVPRTSKLALSDSNNTHWYAGSRAPEQLQDNARTVSMSIKVPDSAPPYYDEQYAILLSAWDDNSSYDQLGFTAYHGGWEIGYSWTTINDHDYENLDYHTYWSEMPLSCGVKYTFNITVQDTVATFCASTGGTVIWSQNVTTGGHYLILKKWFEIGGTYDYWDYTDYEEVYNTHTYGDVPPFNFNFTDQQWISVNGSAHTPTWTNVTHADAGSYVPSCVAVSVNGDSVLVVNQQIDIAVVSLNPIPPHYSDFQVYHNGMRLNNQSISMNYHATISRTDSTMIVILVVEVDLLRTDDYGDHRTLDTKQVLLLQNGTAAVNLVWNETTTADPATWHISALATLATPNTWDLYPANNQLMNDTVHAVFLTGDVNGDGVVDIFDAIQLAGCFGKLENQTGYNPDCNFSHVSDPITGLQMIDIYDAGALGGFYGFTIYGPPGRMSSGGGGGIIAAGATSVLLVPSQITVFKGEVFSVNVTVTNVANLYGWEFKLFWNSTVLNCTSVIVQTPTEWQNNNQTVGSGLQTNYNATHSLYWQGEYALYPAPSFNGTTTMVTLIFLATQPGTTPLTLTDVKLADNGGQPINYTAASGSVTAYYGRYMRSDTKTVNGLSAYFLNATETTSYASQSDWGYGRGATWGIRAWIRHANGVEQEISLDGQTGTPCATVTRATGSGMLSATTSVSQTPMQTTDSIVVRVYFKTPNSDWMQVTAYTTEQLGATTLVGTSWTVYYYTWAQYYSADGHTTGIFYWGDTTHNSRIQNLQSN
jgi:hypothetical protein